MTRRTNFASGTSVIVSLQEAPQEQDRAPQEKENPTRNYMDFEKGKRVKPKRSEAKALFSFPVIQ